MKGLKFSCFLLLLADIIVFILIIGLTILAGLAAKSTGKAEVLEIRESGTAVWYEDAEKLQDDYIPTDAAYELAIKDFIRGLRMIEAFYDDNEYLVKRALCCSTGNASAMLQEKLETENPFELYETKTVDVPYNSITVTKISQTQWKASWRERTYDANGTLTMEADYESVFHIMLTESPDLKGSYINPKEYNPLGIYIYEYDIDLLKKLM